MKDTETNRFYRSVGSKLRQARELRGLSLTAASLKLKVSKGNLSMLENGMHAMTLSRFMDLAKLFRVKPADILPPRKGRRTRR